MRLRYTTSLMFAGLLAASVAFAAKPAPQIIDLAGEPIQSLSVGGPINHAVCEVGISTGAASIINYLLPPDDAYYTLLDPSTCSSCNGALQLSVAHMLLNFQAVCTQQVQVRVVPAVNNAGCYVPDVNTAICAPIIYNLTPGAIGNFQFNLALPLGCCVTGPVFLDINFITVGAGCSTSATRPRLIVDATPLGCTSWNVYPGGFDDLVNDIGFPGNPVMWAEGDCCPTPTTPGSWGRIKTLYR